MKTMRVQIPDAEYPVSTKISKTLGIKRVMTPKEKLMEEIREGMIEAIKIGRGEMQAKTLNQVLSEI